MPEQNDNQITNPCHAVYLQHFIAGLNQQGFGHLTKDAESVADALESVQVLKERLKSANEEIAPLFEALTKDAMKKLREGAEPTG